MPDSGSGWLVEEGIAEHRAVRLAGEWIIAARVEWPGRLAPGWVIDARLIARSAGSARGTAVATNGEDVLLDRLPRTAAQGASLRVVVTRAALDGPSRFKRAQARPIEAPLAQPSLADRLSAQVVHRFPTADWDTLIDDALAGEITFAGGTLLFAPTPAMTTVDVDGDLAAKTLALTAVPALADALRRFDLAGSVAVDFPTLTDKADRRDVDDALGRALGDWPHERTAMNGFGLVQLISRMERPSVLHLAAWQRAGLVWRRLLRRAERLTGPGTIEVSMHPALEAVAVPAHCAELERRTGRRVRLRSLATLARDAPNAQTISNE